MARMTERLTALKVSRLKRPGYHHDGLGLYLQISKTGTKSWVFRFMLDGRPRWMGLGPTHTISLAEAREKARQARKDQLEGKDPIEQRRAERAAQRAAGARVKSFRQCGEEFIEKHEGGWGAVHRRQWKQSLAQHVYPVLGDVRVDAITTELVMQVIEPLWQSIPETASRVRNRIENILDFARVRVYRVGENPADWRHLKHLLPPKSQLHRVKHFAALPYVELPGFLVELRGQKGIPARALEYAILTAARTGEVIGAKWAEINLTDGSWTVPAERMKARREHRVPLSTCALAILQEMKALRRDGDSNAYVFPGKGDQPLSSMAFLMLLRRMGRTDLTPHGCRASFRTWCDEQTSYPHHVTEQALGHAISNAVEKAYRRGDMFEQRRRLMDAWGTFCTSDPVEHGKVVPMQRRG